VHLCVEGCCCHGIASLEENSSRLHQLEELWRRLPNCLTVAILLLLRDAHPVERMQRLRIAHSAIAGLFVLTREISPFSRSSMRSVMFRALAMR
jgi:hypothetical protein